jgi:hypothetical protein
MRKTEWLQLFRLCLQIVREVVEMLLNVPPFP